MRPNTETTAARYWRRIRGLFIKWAIGITTLTIITALFFPDRLTPILGDILKVILNIANGLFG